jgi:hypothetical protein
MARQKLAAAGAEACSSRGAGTLGFPAPPRSGGGRVTLESVKSQKEKLAETQFASLEAMMLAYADEAVRVAADGHRVRLDFSPQSIEELEEILAGQAAVDLEYQTRTWGSYFGEVLRRQWGGEWAFTQYPNAVAAVPTLEIAGSRLYPLMKVNRRLTLGDSESLTAFLELVKARLGTSPSRVN